MIEQDALNLQCSCRVNRHYRRRFGVLRAASAQCAVSEDTAGHDTSPPKRERQQISLTSMGCCRVAGQLHLCHAGTHSPDCNCQQHRCLLCA